MSDEKKVEAPEVEVKDEQTPAEAEHEFESAFAEERGTKPPPKPEAKTADNKEKPKEEPKEVKEAPKAQADPWKDGFEKRMRNIEGHIGGLKSMMEKGFAAAKATAAAGADAPTDKQITQAHTPEKWKQLKEDFPQWAEAVEEFVASRPAPKVDAPKFDADSFRKQMFEELVQPALRVTALEARESAKLDLKHEGWEERVGSAEFSGWLETQPEDVKKLIESPYFKDADRVLVAFGEFQKAQAEKQRKRDRLETAAPVQGSGQGGPPTLDDDAAFVGGFNGVRGGGR